MTDADLSPQSPRALSAGAPAPVGEFVYVVADARWWWSDRLYALYGFAPGEVVPSDDLMVRHLHPEDRAVVESALLDTLRDGQPFASLHRIRDAHGRERTVLTVGRGDLTPDGSVTEIRGYVVDLTLANRAAAQHEVDAAVAGVTVHRAAIEQAKGMLMALQGLSSEAAFGLLRDYSQRHNVKLRSLAERLVEAADRIAGSGDGLDLDTLLDVATVPQHNGDRAGTETAVRSRPERQHPNGEDTRY